MVVFYTIVSFAQSESVKPTFGVKLDREVVFAKIEKETFQDVIVELKSADLGDLFTEGVKVIVKDAKTGKNCIASVFPSHIFMHFPMVLFKWGKGNALTQLTLFKSKEYDAWFMEIRKNGIY